MSDMESIHPDISSIHRCRSVFMDAFAEIEAKVSAILTSAGNKPTHEPFGQRLEKFRTVEASQLLAKANLNQRNQLANKIAELLPVRADIVHSVFRSCLFNGMPAIRIINAQHESDLYPMCRILTERDLINLTEKASQLARKLTGLKVNQPSSPQPPSQAATAVP